jgi:hypothetical protein
VPSEAHQCRMPEGVLEKYSRQVRDSVQGSSDVPGSSADLRRSGTGEMRADRTVCELGSSLFRRFRDDRTGSFPRALGTLGFWLIAIDDAIILVRFAHRAQGLVIEAWKTKGFFEFFAELVKSFQVIGRSRYFRFRSLQELLVAAIHQLRNFTTDKVAGIGKYLGVSFFVLLNGGRNVVFLQEEAILGSGRLDQIKAMIAQPVHHIIESPLFYLTGHQFLRFLSCPD